jgi:putative methylase
MKEIRSLKSLGYVLSKLKQIQEIDRENEQYQTPSEIASEIIWSAMLNGDITDNVIYDLGAGNGIFGIGALLCGGLKCVFVDIDPKTKNIIEENTKACELKPEEEFIILNNDIKNFRDNIDINKIKEEIEFESDVNIRKVVIMNPPFGTKKVHADREFLVKAFEFSDVIYSIHMKDTIGFLNAISNDSSFNITHTWEFNFGIKKSHDMHKKNKLNVPIICVRMERKV